MLLKTNNRKHLIKP